MDFVGWEHRRSVRWDRGETKPEYESSFLYGKGNDNSELGSGFHKHKRIISLVRR
jgi:hypothetical protein